MKHILPYNIYNNTIRKIDKLTYVEYDITLGSILVEPPRVDMDMEELPKVVFDFMYLKDKKDDYSIEKININDIIISQNILVKNNLINLATQKIKTPIKLLNFNDKYYLIDGNHRYAVWYLSGEKYVNCIVYKK